MAYRALNRHQNAYRSIFKEFNSTQNPLSITNNNFDNFERKKVVIWTILALNQEKSLSVVDRRF